MHSDRLVDRCGVGRGLLPGSPSSSGITDLTDANERRRVRLVVIGAVAGLVPGFAAIALGRLQAEPAVTAPVRGRQRTGTSTGRRNRLRPDDSVGKREVQKRMADPSDVRSGRAVSKNLDDSCAELTCRTNAKRPFDVAGRALAPTTVDTHCLLHPLRHPADRVAADEGHRGDVGRESGHGVRAIARAGDGACAQPAGRSGPSGDRPRISRSHRRTALTLGPRSRSAARARMRSDARSTDRLRAQPRAQSTGAIPTVGQ